MASPSLGAKDFLKIMCKVISLGDKTVVDGGFRAVLGAYINIISFLERVHSSCIFFYLLKCDLRPIHEAKSATEMTQCISFFIHVSISSPLSK
jgi:hypothetical protein